MRIKIIVALMMMVVSGSAFGAGEKALTRGCKKVVLHGTFLPTGSDERKSVAIECAWGDKSNPEGINEIVVKSATADGATFEVVPPIDFFRKDKDVNREGNFLTGVAVMLGDKSRNFLRFCSYYVDEDKSASYLEVGKVVASGGKETMQRHGVLIVESASFYNIDGGSPREVVKDYKPQNDFYMNALWDFFDRIYKAYVPRR